jgi:hypothetical protein
MGGSRWEQANLLVVVPGTLLLCPRSRFDLDQKIERKIACSSRRCAANNKAA